MLQRLIRADARLHDFRSTRFCLRAFSRRIRRLQRRLRASIRSALGRQFFFLTLVRLLRGGFVRHTLRFGHAGFFALAGKARFNLGGQA